MQSNITQLFGWVESLQVNRSPKLEKSATRGFVQAVSKCMAKWATCDDLAGTALVGGPAVEYVWKGIQEKPNACAEAYFKEIQFVNKFSWLVSDATRPKMIRVYNEAVSKRHSLVGVGAAAKAKVRPGAAHAKDIVGALFSKGK